MRICDLIEFLSRYPSGYDVRISMPQNNRLSPYFTIRENRAKGFLWLEAFDFAGDNQNYKNNEFGECANERRENP